MLYNIVNDYTNTNIKGNGLQFEDKIIENMLFDEQYANKVLPYTKPDYFDGNYKVIVDQILQFFIAYNTTPTRDELKIELGNRRGLNDNQLKEINELIDQYKRDNSDREWLLKTTEKFYQERSLTGAVINAAGILEKGGQNTNEILKMVQDALSVSFDSNLGHDYFDNAHDRFDAYHVKEDKIPTGMATFDRITLGGFSRKSLNCVIAQSGCHAKGTQIVMADGSYKSVEDVQVGDKLVGYNGEYRTVLELRRGQQTMYRIVPIRGKPFVVNEDHILALHKSGTDDIVNVSVKDYIKSSYYFKNHHYLWKNPQPVKFVNNVNLPIDPYFVGVWLGDGATHSLMITTKQPEIEQYLYEFAQKEGCHVHKFANLPSKVSFNYRICMNSNRSIDRNPIVLKFEKLGINIGNTTARSKINCEEKFIPEVYLQSSVDQRYQLLAGLLDTDGYKHPSFYEYTSKSKRLVNDIARLVGSLGLTYNFYQREVNGVTYYRISIFGDISKIPCRVEYKKSNFERTQKKDPHALSFKVEKLDCDDYYGFLLDGDHLYYDGNWVLHHNSGKTLFMINTACNVLRSGFNVLYLTLEMSEVRIAERMDANLLDVTIPALSRISLKQYTDRVTDLKKQKHGRLIIKEFPTSTASVLHFKNLLNELKLKQGFIPDLIVVDYINLMMSSRYKPGQTNSYGMVKAISEELRGLAVETNTAILTATQTNRSGFNNSDIEMTEVSDSIGLIFTLDMLFALIRTEALDQAGQVMFKQLKNRYSDLNLLPVFQMGIDRDHMRIYDFDDPPQSNANNFEPQRKPVGSKMTEVAPGVITQKTISPKNDFSKFTF